MGDPMLNMGSPYCRPARLRRGGEAFESDVLEVLARGVSFGEELDEPLCLVELGDCIGELRRLALELLCRTCLRRLCERGSGTSVESEEFVWVTPSISPSVPDPELVSTNKVDSLLLQREHSPYDVQSHRGM